MKEIFEDFVRKLRNRIKYNVAILLFAMSTPIFLKIDGLLQIEKVARGVTENQIQRISNPKDTTNCCDYYDRADFRMLIKKKDPCYFVSNGYSKERSECCIDYINSLTDSIYQLDNFINPQALQLTNNSLPTLKTKVPYLLVIIFMECLFIYGLIWMLIRYRELVRALGDLDEDLPFILVQFWEMRYPSLRLITNKIMPILYIAGPIVFLLLIILLPLIEYAEDFIKIQEYIDWIPSIQYGLLGVMSIVAFIIHRQLFKDHPQITSIRLVSRH